jgi:V/A-type H+-transporting ATPase subunit A
MTILQEEAALDEIVRLVGMDALSQKDRLKMETAKIVREDYLHQNAFHEIDTYTSLEKQYKMLKLIRAFYDYGNEAIENYADLNDVLDCPAKEKIGRAKYTEENNLHELDDALNLLTRGLKSLSKGVDE